MDEKEFRWYRMWYFTAAMWGITFLSNVFYWKRVDWIVVIQFLNILLSLGAGIINGRRYKRRNGNKKN